MSDPAIHRELGEINANLKIIMDQQRQSAESRAAIYAKLQDGELRMQKIESNAEAANKTIKQMQSDIQLLQPLADKVKEWQIKGITIISSAAFVGGLIVTAFMALKERILSAFGW